MQPPFVEPTPASVIHQECPIQCPQGPPGRDVSVIHCTICAKHISIYFLSFPIKGIDGRSIIGEKGERGERGYTVKKKKIMKQKVRTV